MIREPVQYVRHDGPIPEMKPARRPDTLAEARAVNARLHIRMARGRNLMEITALWLILNSSICWTLMSLTGMIPGIVRCTCANG